MSPVQGTKPSNSCSTGGALPNRIKQSPVVEPIYPFQRRNLHGLEMPPRPSGKDRFGLIQADYGLSESIGRRSRRSPLIAPWRAKFRNLRGECRSLTALCYPDAVGVELDLHGLALARNVRKYEEVPWQRAFRRQERFSRSASFSIGNGRRL